MIKYIFSLCFILLLASTTLAGRRHCHSCGVYYAPVVNTAVTVVEEKQIHAPERIVRYREIPGLRIVEDSHGNQSILIGNKVLNTFAGKTESITEEIKGSVVTERIITRRDIYGNQTVTVEKEISK